MNGVDGESGVVTTTYGASPLRRRRSTKAEMADFRAALYDLVIADAPMTVRHAFYLAVATFLVEKTEQAYARVQRQLAQMRRQPGAIIQGSPFDSA